MKRFLVFAYAVFLVALPWNTASAAEIIRDFDVRAELSADRQLLVTETIVYDFGEGAERHGIFRRIPETHVRQGTGYSYQFSVQGVALDGSPVPYDVSREDGALHLKIGDPDTLISGAHTYAISYETDRAVNFFDGHDELYWNVTGNDWPAAIERASFSLALPDDIPSAHIRTACFTGVYGSEESACDGQAGESRVVFTSTRLLHPQEGMSVVIGVPKGIFLEPTPVERLGMVVRDNGLLGIPLLAALAMGSLWWVKGRDPRMGTVIPHYESSHGLPPAELSAAQADGTVPERGVTATILDLARRGYLHIRYLKKFTFVKHKDADDSLTTAESAILKGLFSKGTEVAIDDLKKNNFHADVKHATEAVWAHLRDMQLFEKRPIAVRAGYTALATFLGIMLAAFLSHMPLGFIVAIATAAIVLAFGWLMPRRTRKGANVLAEIKGFEWFLSVTEKERLAFHNAPQRTPEQFHALLPFAVALGVEEEWAKQFAGISIPPPEWAEGDSWSTTSALAFVSAVDAFHGKAASSGYHNPSTAGGGGSGFSGGFSGGGGGGGGGGSW